MGIYDKMSSLGDKVVSGVSKISRKPVLIIGATFYKDIAEMMKEAAIEEIEQASLRYEYIEVPGVFELPAAVSFALVSQKYSSFVALGCVIRGETTHYDYVCQESARGLNEISYQMRVPIGYGVVTAENMEQALYRADKNGKNVGGRAAYAAITMSKLKSSFPPPPRKLGS